VREGERRRSSGARQPTFGARPSRLGQRCNRVYARAVPARKVGGRGGRQAPECTRGRTCVRMRVRIRPLGGREKGERTGEEPYLRGRGERLEVIHRRETRERNIACELRDWPSAGQRAGRGSQFVKTRGFQDDSGGNRSRSLRWSPRSRFANRV